MIWSFRTNGNYVDFVHTDETDLHIEQTIFHLHNTSRCIDWSLPVDTTRITFTIDESKYENVSIYDIDFDGVVMNIQGDFETNITSMFSGLAGGASSSYLVATKILTDDEIKALPTTGIEIVAAPGSNKMIQPVFMTLIADTNLAEYTNIHANGYLDLSSDGGAYWGVIIGNRGAETLTDLTTLLGITGNGWFSSVIQNWAVASSYYAMYMPNVLEISTVINKSVKITCGNSGAGNFTGGNAANTLKVILQYIIIDLS